MVSNLVCAPQKANYKTFIQVHSRVIVKWIFPLGICKLHIKQMSLLEKEFLVKT